MSNTTLITRDKKEICLDASKPFVFLEIREGHQCPHCGAEGRWVYVWAEYGKTHSAMAGCYKLLTGKLDKDEDTRYFELLAEKQAKNKPLNGWDKSIMRLQEFKAEGKYPDAWINQKMLETLQQRKQFLAKKYR